MHLPHVRNDFYGISNSGGGSASGKDDGSESSIRINNES